MSDGTERCNWCGKWFIEEELTKHPCFTERNPVKEITIDFVYETKSRDGDRTIHAYGLNGDIYLLTLPSAKNLKALRKEIASDESKQRFAPRKSDGEVPTPEFWFC
jgi:hypothetical protein